MIAWSIAGSDSGGGAGVQADIKTFRALGVHGCTVITAITAQNTQGVSGVEYVSNSMVEAQMRVLAADLSPKAIKVGMLGSSDVILSVARCLPQSPCFIVCDPVMVSTSKDPLMEQSARQTLIDVLLQKVDLLTPNLSEAEALCGFKIKEMDDVLAAAVVILEYGAKSVLIKGGHFSGKFSQDYWSNGKTSFWLTSPRVKTVHTHGTGCTLSSAIAACMALGYQLDSAMVIAKAFVSQGLRLAPALGMGFGPVCQSSWPESEQDLPWITSSQQDGEARSQFPDCGEESLGFYPIVEHSSLLKKILPLGVRTVQLRIKDLSGSELEKEIQASIELAQHYKARLFINDFWELALKYGAYGVHLGQKDLSTTALQALKTSNLRLGISAYSYADFARGLALRPSYIAFGPIYETYSKQMEVRPHGLTQLARLRKSFARPIVAIGGISLARAPDVLATGVDGIAVISALTKASSLEDAVISWVELIQNHLTTQLTPKRDIS